MERAGRMDKLEIYI